MKNANEKALDQCFRQKIILGSKRHELTSEKRFANSSDLYKSLPNRSEFFRHMVKNNQWTVQRQNFDLIVPLVEPRVSQFLGLT